MSTSTKVPNRLINEKSGYLQQHAHNPVDWFPWCGEAFEKAVREDKPIFLSIGYSTCHWCHVMERESFEDEEVAELLNRYFISIKVDREERPDVDSIYMSVCQILTGSGGWPLSIFMDAEKKPFFAGTYFPKHDRGRHTGIISLLKQIMQLWKNGRDRLANTSEQILVQLQREEKAARGNLDISAVDSAVSYFTKYFDPVYGGFGSAPKFPSPHNLMFLLRVYSATQNQSLISIAEKTLEGMARGGIYDHIGFGFSRYSTDEKWLVPHFEKMLYDNALLSMAYTETYHLTKNKIFRKAAEDIFTYAGRDMRSADGAFYSAEDADSEGAEGKFYVWTPNEIIDVLGDEDGNRFCQMYDITERGNFEGGSIPNLIGKNLSEEDSVFADKCRDMLFWERKKRIHPFKDKKIIVSWNGLMIAGLAIASKTFGNNKYLEWGENCAEYLYKNISGRENLFADDYAFFAWGLIELYQTTFNEKYLKFALEATQKLLDEFWDQDSAGLFLYSKNAEQLLIRPKEIYDGAMPSANAVFAYNMIRLSRITGQFEYEEKASEVLSHFSDQIQNAPAAYTFSLISLLYLNEKSKEVVLAAESDEQAAEMIAAVRACSNPFVTCVLKTQEHKDISELAGFTKDYDTIDDKCTAYVCEGTACYTPVTDSRELINLLLR